MVLDVYEILALGAAVVAVVMFGKRHLCPGLVFFALFMFFIVFGEIFFFFFYKEINIFFFGICFFVIMGVSNDNYWAVVEEIDQTMFNNLQGYIINFLGAPLLVVTFITF